jgi:Poly-adenylate binding protein, unique domain
MKMYGHNINQNQPIPQGNFINNKFNPQFKNQMMMNIPQKNIRQQEDKNEINLDYLNSMEDNESKREYLGEIIFKKIENHPLSQKYELNINKIGKTTGMILAIDDLKVIIDICKNEENLTAYIQEAYELLKESEN